MAEKSSDAEKATNESDLAVITFDLEAVLQTPKSQVSQTYYKRKLNSYNLSMYNLGNGEGTNYFWSEMDGARGANEVATFLNQYIDSLNAKHIVLYSDNCPGQNKNCIPDAYHRKQ